MTPQRIAYGPHPEQYAEWSTADDSRGVVVVIHGGFWRDRYDLGLGRPLARDLLRRGWSTLNLEYRRIGNGGGTPETFDDVAAGIELLAELPNAVASKVVLLGHSAGGHLATWAAGRGRFGWPDTVQVTHVVAQAGILDLRAASSDGLSNSAVVELLGHLPGASDAPYDPRQQLPLDVPVTCLHAPDDVQVPIGQSRDYVAAAREAGARADLVEVSGGHFGLIDPGSAAWTQVVEVLDSL